MENTITVAMGLRMASMRKKRELTQEELANKAGLSMKTISAAENGHKAMRPESIVKVCDALSISTDYLLKGEMTGVTIMGQEKMKQLSHKQKLALSNIMQEIFDAFV